MSGLALGRIADQNALIHGERSSKNTQAIELHWNSGTDDVIGGIKANDSRLKGTIEFFPKEGKYHHDGHRACGVRFTREETNRHGCLCPVCGKPLVVGVDYRVGKLADRVVADELPTKATEYIVPLSELIAELQGRKSTTGKVYISIQAMTAYTGQLKCLRTKLSGLSNPVI